MAAQIVRPGLDQHLLDIAAERGDLGDARDCGERRAQHLVLEAAKLEQRHLPTRIGQRVLEHPAGARRQRADLEPDGRRQRDARDALADRGATRRQIALGIEHYVDVSHTGHRRAAHRRYTGDAGGSAVRT